MDTLASNASWRQTQGTFPMALGKALIRGNVLLVLGEAFILSV